MLRPHTRFAPRSALYFVRFALVALAAACLVLAAGCGNNNAGQTQFPTPQTQNDAGGLVDAGFDAGPTTTDTANTSEDAGAPDAGGQDTAPTCVDPCEPEGATRCTIDGKGTEACEDPDKDGCFAWSDVVTCGATEVCSAGKCAPKCPDQDCTAAGAKKCDANGKIVTCFDFNGDGCLAWGGPKDCPSGQVCSKGFCALSCTDECTTVGAKKCEGKAVVTCSDSNKDGCLDWASKAACGATQTCSGGFCADTCKDECTQKGATNCDQVGIVTCDDYNKDGCLQWGTAVACPTGQKCSSGKCATTCKDECTVKGGTTCQLGKVAMCGDFNKDGCLQWGSPVPCAKGLVCNEGKCAKNCSDECTVKGAKQCSPAGKVQVCDDYDNNGCLQWGSGVGCPAKTVCSNGLCATSCKDACAKSGAKQCVPGSKTQWQSCGDFNKDGCLEWGTPTACGNNLVCAGAGGCEKTCKSTCTKAGAKTCDGDAVRSCGDFNKDGCLEWGTPQPCTAAQACKAGACAEKPPPAKVVINELVYDSAGPDTQTFLELRGPAGTPLQGFSLVGINGKGGVAYVTVPLAGKIGGDGFFVIAHTKATGALKAAADQAHKGVDFQNGADSVVLQFGDKAVDAVGYGNFGSGLVFKGEGKPTIDVLSGQALGRDHLGTDTDNNEKDFRAILKPTPGAANPKPCIPKSCKDVGAMCGTVNDGCGKVLACGKCPSDKVCGADKKCGDKPCVANTCKEQGVACGPASDGCNKTLACGNCGAGKACSKGQCICKPKTCQELGTLCGTAPDGCGKTLQCGVCAGGKTCSKGQCLCTPKTCKALGVGCGTPPDGCGKKLACGTCSSGKVCGPSGQCNCAPKSCKDLGLLCGPASDGCGKALTCGTCATGKQCSKGKCVCQPKTCAALGCGKQADGCGGTVDCGPCGGACGQVCPSGFAMASDKVCSGGDVTKVDLAFCTVNVGGKILNNGKDPLVTTKYCSKSKNYYSTYAQVTLTETTWGYKYTVGLKCQKEATQKFNWAREIVPGTYKVEVYGTSNYANFPFTTTQVIYPALDLTKSKTDIVLDFRTVKVGGKILNNGKEPLVTTKYCSKSKNYYSTYAQVTLTETTWGYKYTVGLKCQKEATQKFNWGREIVPGTYKVQVYGTSNYANFPFTTTQVVYPKLDLTKPKSDLVLDFRTVKVGGKILNNGKEPLVTTKYCSKSKNYYSTYAQVTLTETTWGYKYTVGLKCQKEALQKFNWAREIVPGTYKVEVYGTSNYANFPFTTTQVIHPALVLTKAKSDVVLDFRTVKVGGKILNNGKEPLVTTKYCSKSKNYYSTYAQVTLTETTWGYKYTVGLKCQKEATQKFNWAREIVPGTYKVEVYGTSNYANFPFTTTQVIHPALALTKAKSDIVLDFRTVKVGGKILNNGKDPLVTTKYCSKSKNYYSTYAQVTLTETTWGYKYTVGLKCQKEATQKFNWAREIVPGTYKVEVYGTSNYANFPFTTTQVIYPKLDLSSAKSDVVLDFRTVKIGGRIFNNGKTPQVTTKYCSKSKNYYSTYAQVTLTETTWGYKYTVGLKCQKEATQQFNWAREIVPGTYKIEVYGTSNYANFPFTTTQVVVPKILLK